MPDRSLTCISLCYRQVTILLACLMWAIACQAQVTATVDFMPPNAYDFVDASSNSIVNSASLNEFYELLYQQKISGTNKISIVHIGDSHIQGDYMTRMTREAFQHNFGNAGRGLIVPFRVAKSNEPENYITSSNAPWQVHKVINPPDSMTIGVGAVTLRCNYTDASIHIKTLNTGGLDYGFNKLTLFYRKNSESFDFNVRNPKAEEVAFINSSNEGEFPFTSAAYLPHIADEVTLENVQTISNQQFAEIYGICLENGNGGILYHAIGVNGAAYSNYNNAPEFSKQVQALYPDLVIISMGTNEAQTSRFDEASFRAAVGQLLESIRATNPNATFLLTTPAGSFRSKQVNHTVGQVHDAIIRYAAENQIAYWDLYAITGGENSATNWRAAGLMFKDGVHYTQSGYALQGNLLFQALMNGYNSYLAQRHP